MDTPTAVGVLIVLIVLVDLVARLARTNRARRHARRDDGGAENPLDDGRSKYGFSGDLLPDERFEAVTDASRGGAALTVTRKSAPTTVRVRASRETWPASP